MTATVRRLPHSLGWALECDQHRGYGSLPCSWPACRNGVPEDSLVVFDQAGRVRTFRYARVAWPAFDGEPYFSWEEEELGSWFTAESVVSREVERRAPPFPQPSLAYHYTTAAGLQGIIDQKELWLTDFGYLNDAREIEHGISVAERLLQHGAGDAAGLRSKWLAALRKAAPARMCMAAFSLDGDSLSQWRAYGNLSLGFDLGGDFGHAPGVSSGRIIYEPAKQEAHVRLFLHHYAAALDRDSRAVSMPDIAVDATMGRLHRRLAFLKDPGFADEREARLIYFEDPAVLVRFGQPLASRRFRVSGAGLVSYTTTLDVAMSEPAQLPLRKVVVGPQPHADVVLRGVADFLDAHGYAGTEIVPSEIPFRRGATFGGHGP